MNNFQRKKIVIMGLGLYARGSGISAAKFFISQGAKVLITDLKSKKELVKQIKDVLKFYRSQIKKNKSKIYKPVFILGKHREDDFKSADIVMKNPAVRADSTYLKIAEKAGARIETDISLFFKLCRAPIVGITGTRGKSTTTTLVHRILEAAEYRAYLGGNIQISPLSFLNKVETQGLASLRVVPNGAETRLIASLQKTIIVLELSSWMLESTGAAKLSPKYALITNLMPDHLNTYGGMKDYIMAKENIFAFQRASDVAVYNYDNKITRKMGERARAKRFWFSAKYFGDENGCFVKNGKIFFRADGKVKNICGVSDIKISGAHNLQNVLAAVCLASAMGISPAAIKKAVKKFRGIPNRLEFIREFRGLKFYNDTTATTPDAVIAALRVLSKNPPPLTRGGRGRVRRKHSPLTPFLSHKGRWGVGKIILIAGGSDKNLEFAGMARELKKQKVRLVIFPGKATEKLIAELDKIHYNVSSQPVRDMKSAVNLARSLATRGDIILLSPGAASFGLFQNEFDRGRQFVKIVKELR